MATHCDALARDFEETEDAEPAQPRRGGAVIVRGARHVRESPTLKSDDNETTETTETTTETPMPRRPPQRTSYTSNASAQDHNEGGTTGDPPIFRRVGFVRS